MGGPGSENRRLRNNRFSGVPWHYLGSDAPSQVAHLLELAIPRPPSQKKDTISSSPPSRTPPPLAQKRRHPSAHPSVTGTVYRNAIDPVCRRKGTLASRAAHSTMPRKRTRDEMEAAEPEEQKQEPSLLQRIRNMWEFASVMQYIFMFGKAVKIDENFDIEVCPAHIFIGSIERETVTAE